MSDCNFTLISDPIIKETITQNDVMKTLSGQMSDTFFYLSIAVFVYILLNMNVFNESARFRKYFDMLDGEKYQIKGAGSIRDLVCVCVQMLALICGLMLVILNLNYRIG